MVAISQCVKFGVAITRASISGSAQSSRKSVVVFFNPHSRPPPLQQRRIGIASSDKPSPIIQPNPRHMVIIANFPGADQRDTNRIGGSLFHFHIEHGGRLIRGARGKRLE